MLGMVERSSRGRPGTALRSMLVVATLIGVGTSLEPVPAPATSGVARLPEVVNAPGTWSDEEGVSGPVAAVGIATRTRPVGLLDRRESLSLFAVSALEGRSTWLKLPGFSLNRSSFTGGVAVSPDGRWLGWVRTSTRSGRWPLGRIVGWSVMDTATGRIRRLEVERFDFVRGTTADLAFSGDSRHLLINYETPDRPAHGTRGHQFVAWDVSDGTPTVLEKPGHFWLPNLGLAPSGVVWSRNRQVFRADPAAGTITRTTLPRDVLRASWAPDDTAFAYVGRDSQSKASDERLYVASAGAGAGPGREVDLPKTSPIGEFLAWRDPMHAVVGNFRGDVYVVDITDATVQTIALRGRGEQVNTPVLATALWQQPLGTAAESTGTTDPRRLWRWAAAAGVAMAFGTVARRRWKRPTRG